MADPNAGPARPEPARTLAQVADQVRAHPAFSLDPDDAVWEVVCDLTTNDDAMLEHLYRQCDPEVCLHYEPGSRGAVMQDVVMGNVAQLVRQTPA